MTNISVVIPTYNRRETLTRAVNSVLAQDHAIYEIIVVDDGSTDGTASLPVLRDPRVQYLVNPRNLGSQGSRNRGVEAARGDAIAFLDSDDYWDPSKIGKQLAAVASNGWPALYAVTCGYTQFGKTGGFTLNPAEQIHLVDVMVHNLIGPTSVLLASRAIFDAVGNFDATMPACQDWELFIRILERVPVFGVPEVLVHQDTGSGGRITGQTDKVIRGHQELFDRIQHTAAFRELPKWKRALVKHRQQRVLRRL